MVGREGGGEFVGRGGLAAVGGQDTAGRSGERERASLEGGGGGVTGAGREDNGWTYDAGNNAVVLHGGAIPRPDMEIVITYYLLL